MQQHDVVAGAFGATAASYLSSAVHASGADLGWLADTLRAVETPRHADGLHVLDLGCGAGHASFAVAPVSASVCAYDLSADMLHVVEAAAADRGLANVRTQQGVAERLPFEDASFDCAVSRMSAHHWRDVGSALAELHRVLRPGGRFLLIDVAGGDDPLCDSHFQAVELLRDGSHVRDYRRDEWLSMLADNGFQASVSDHWWLRMAFDTWVARMRTPPERVAAIRSLWSGAPDEVRQHYRVEADGSFQLEVLSFAATRV
ncbi:class I SAM-dependent methyltransferase [Chitinasiproducens palmae]|uniref:Methyltransferase domain-containing protein n=1 Tax=Chitinasiproducens palmae TaxID=1770053 RepID=A0A1H2PP01_9BURK|nr:class I SAM-dependent methyltransferase [Chitinasiproducens palmae]SDV47979.1 Methyltransferase domain-containing protein [Chitinasiproducens palmae]